MTELLLGSILFSIADLAVKQKNPCNAPESEPMKVKDWHGGKGMAAAEPPPKASAQGGSGSFPLSGYEVGAQAPI